MDALLPLLLIAIIFRIGFDVFVALAGGKIENLLANIIFSGLAALLPLIIYLSMKTKNSVATTKSGIIYSVLAGLSVGIFSIILLRLFEKGSNISFVIPAIYGGTLIGTSIIGWLLFKEAITFTSALGVIIITIGTGVLLVSKT